ncbi:MAG TPA: alpha/beta hydrolase [Galbitalea sp.]|nr:alpha/beta hydrolase [Galbitalea sp.]
MDVRTPDGQRIAYRRIDGARPVLLVHGFASNVEATWGATGWLRAFEDAGRGVLAVDLRGHGASSKPTDAASYAAETLARDLVAVLDAEGLVVADVIGYSMGSQVARELAGQHPERVSRLVLGGIGSSEPFAKVGVPAIRAALRDGRPIDDPFLDGLLAGAQDLPETERAALAACAEGMATAPVALVPLAPTLVAAGELDPIAVGALALANQLAASYFEIPGRRHGNSLSARAFKQVVIDFLGVSRAGMPEPGRVEP